MANPLSVVRAKQLDRFGTIESISLLLLLLIAMPLKYIWNEPRLVTWVGMFHGIAFMIYVVIVLRAQLETRWPLWYTVVAVLASFVPFGPAIVQKKLLNNV